MKHSGFGAEGAQQEADEAICSECARLCVLLNVFIWIFNAVNWKNTAQVRPNTKIGFPAYQFTTQVLKLDQKSPKRPKEVCLSSVYFNRTVSLLVAIMDNKGGCDRSKLKRMKSVCIVFHPTFHPQVIF